MTTIKPADTLEQHLSELTETIRSAKAEMASLEADHVAHMAEYEKQLEAGRRLIAAYSAALVALTVG